VKPSNRINCHNGPLNSAIPKSLAAVAVLTLFATFEQSDVHAAALRTVALNGQSAPGTPSGVAFNGFGAYYDSLAGVYFRGPVLNDAGQTAFRADVAGSGVDSTNSQGVWSEGSGTLSLVARTGSQAPGAPSGVNFRIDPAFELFSPVLNGAGQTAFYGGLTDGNVGLWSEGSGSLALVARGGVQAPGAPPGVTLSFSTGLSPFHLDWPKLNDAGQTAFFGALAGAGVTTTNNWGVWSSGSGSLQLIARAGDQAPGLPTGVIYGVSTFAPPFPAFVGGLNGSGQTALWANLAGNGVVGNSNFGIWSGDSRELTLIAESGTQAPGTPSGVNFANLLSAFASNDSGHVAFAARLAGSGVNSTNVLGLWSNRSGSIELVARSGSQAVGTPNGVNYNYGSSIIPVLNDAGQLAFGSHLIGSGVNSNNDLGIWSDGTGALALVARTGSQAPGTAGGVSFADLNTPALNGAGQTAFRAILTGSGVDVTNDKGIWATDLTGTLQLIARTGEQLEVTPGDFRTPSDLNFVAATGNGDGLQSGFNNLGQLVFWASFTDGSQGVFVSNQVAGLLGDFNRDGRLAGDDIQAMLSALTDLKAYETAHGLSDAALVALGDLNGDHAVTNADIQPLLILLASQGAATSVPEPGSAVLAACGVISLIACARRRRH
jgi:hypothetical protein